jgi:hypothetical protein
MSIFAKPMIILTWIIFLISPTPACRAEENQQKYQDHSVLPIGLLGIKLGDSLETLDSRILLQCEENKDESIKNIKTSCYYSKLDIEDRYSRLDIKDRRKIMGEDVRLMFLHFDNSNKLVYLLIKTELDSVRSFDEFLQKDIKTYGKPNTTEDILDNPFTDIKKYKWENKKTKYTLVKMIRKNGDGIFRDVVYQTKW